MAGFRADFCALSFADKIEWFGLACKGENGIRSEMHGKMRLDGVLRTLCIPFPSPPRDREKAHNFPTGILEAEKQC